MQKENPRYSGDNTPQYRVNLLQIQIDLYKIGYSLNGYRMIMNFVDLAKIEKLEEKLNGEKTPSNTNGDASAQNDSTSTQSESASDQIESSSTHDDFTPTQNDPTLPEITTQVTPESTPEVLKNDDDDINKIKGARESMDQNEILKELIELTSNNDDYKNLLKTLRQSRVEPKEILDIIRFFKDDHMSFDKEVIKQQLTYMSQRSSEDVGISAFSTYFINGVKDRLKSKNIDYYDLDKYLGIEEEELPNVPLYNWLDPENN